MAFRHHAYRRSYRASRFPRRSRRFARRRTYRSKRYNAYTAQRGSATAIGFRRKKIKPRVYRRGLFSFTRFKAHYRSISNQIASYSTGATAGVSTPAALFAIGGLGTPIPFWQVAGGLQVYDNGIAIPTFQDDLILRGGVLSFHLTAPHDIADSVGVRCWWVATVPNPDPAIYAGGIGTVPWGWDPSVTADFTKNVGKVFHVNEAVLNPDNRYVTFEMKLKIRKVDQFDWLNGSRQIMIVFQTCNLTSFTSITLGGCHTWNMSFSGDANGTVAGVTSQKKLVRHLEKKAAESASGMKVDVPSTPPPTDRVAHHRK